MKRNPPPGPEHMGPARPTAPSPPTPHFPAGKSGVSPVAPKAEYDANAGMTPKRFRKGVVAKGYRMRGRRPPKV